MNIFLAKYISHDILINKIGHIIKLLDGSP